MPDLKLIHSGPPTEIEQRVLRISADARVLASTMTGAHVKSVYLILERARDDLSRVLDRMERT